MSSPPWRDVLVKGYCRFNVNDAGAIKLSPRMPACPGATGCGYATVFTAYECLTFHHRILTCQVWARGLGQGFAMGLDLCLTTRFARGTESAEENVFPFSAEGAEKEKFRCFALVIPISQILPEGHADFSLPAFLPR